MDPKTFLFSPRLENPMVINMTHSEVLSRFSAEIHRIVGRNRSCHPRIFGSVLHGNKTTQRYAHLSQDTLLAASNAATLAVGSVMGAMPNGVLDVPLVAALG
jgi:hypothetical protein